MKKILTSTLQYICINVRYNFLDGGAYELTIERSLSDIKENRDSINLTLRV